MVERHHRTIESERLIVLKHKRCLPHRMPNANHRTTRQDEYQAIIRVATVLWTDKAHHRICASRIWFSLQHDVVLYTLVCDRSIYPFVGSVQDEIVCIDRLQIWKALVDDSLMSVSLLVAATSFSLLRL